jgi:hypothetical protein
MEVKKLTKPKCRTLRYIRYWDIESNVHSAKTAKTK